MVCTANVQLLTDLQPVDFMKLKIGKDLKKNCIPTPRLDYTHAFVGRRSLSLTKFERQTARAERAGSQLQGTKLSIYSVVSLSINCR